MLPQTQRIGRRGSSARERGIGDTTMDVGNLDSEAMPYVFSVSGRVEPRHEEPMALPELNRSMEPATYDQLRLMLSSSVVGGINEAVAVLAAEISPTTRCAGGTSR